MASGAFHDVEEALLDAFESAPPAQTTVKPASNRTGADIVTAMQAMPYKDVIEFGDPRPRSESFLELSKSVRGLLTDEEVDTLFARDPSVDRTVDLS